MSVLTNRRESIFGATTWAHRYTRGNVAHFILKTTRVGCHGAPSPVADLHTLPPHSPTWIPAIKYFTCTKQSHYSELRRLACFAFIDQPDGNSVAIHRLAKNSLGILRYLRPTARPFTSWHLPNIGDVLISYCYLLSDPGFYFVPIINNGTGVHVTLNKY